MIMQADGDRRETGGTAGPDCVIAIVPDGQEIGPAERRALRALAEAGLIPEAVTISHSGLSGTTSVRIHRVKGGPRVVESVEPALALH
jgi:hypothetical protein